MFNFIRIEGTVYKKLYVDSPFTSHVVGVLCIYCSANSGTLGYRYK